MDWHNADNLYVYLGVVVVEIVNNNYYYCCLNCIIISHFRCGAGWGVGFIWNLSNKFVPCKCWFMMLIHHVHNLGIVCISDTNVLLKK